MADDPALPRSRLARLGKLAAFGARSGLRKLTGQGDSSGVAELLTDQLSVMRGLALKVGQMASYVDGVIPEDKREAYERALSRLRANAAVMSSDAVRRVVRQELNAEPETLFASFTERPFASASIGQVHRAVLHDGRQVVVKVQHEGVEEAVHSDLANSRVLTSLLGPLGSKFGVADQLAELKARFIEELDYRHEAAAQQRFRQIFADEARLLIPEVIADRSTRRVLTSTFAEGISFDEATRAPEAQRRAWAEALYWFVFASVLWEGVLNADPHPGNYVFAPDGRVHLLDFGCTRQLSPARLASVRQVHQACVRRDEPAFLKAALELVAMVPGTAQGQKAETYVRACFDPVMRTGPFKFTRPFAASLVTQLRAQAKLVATSKAAEVRPLPAELLFFNRLQVGFYSVLARLDVEVDYDKIHTEIVERIPGPPA